MKKISKPLQLAALIMTALALVVIPTSANSLAWQVLDAAVFFEFGQKVSFQARFDPVEEIQSARLFVNAEGSNAVEIPLEITPSGELAIEKTPDELGLHPFIRVYYWYEVTDAQGETSTSPSFWFDYHDTRFDWKTKENNLFTVYTYNRDDEFMLLALSTAQQGLEQAQKIIPAIPPTPIKIIVYNSYADFQTALPKSSQSWIAGHATPEYGDILVTLPPGPQVKLETERQIPHEIVHILQYQQIGKDYTRVPLWLLEGVASINEMYPNPEYSSALTSAAQEGALLPMSTLCSTFPREAGGAFLAYAQSESFTSYIRQQYGDSGIQSLMAAYMNGVGCEQGVAAALGISLEQLESRWRADSLSVNSTTSAFFNLSPWWLLTLIVLVPVLFTFIPTRRQKPAPRGAA